MVESIIYLTKKFKTVLHKINLHLFNSKEGDEAGRYLIYTKYINLLFFLSLWFLNVECKFKRSDLDQLTVATERKILNDKYPKIPIAEMFEKTSGNKIYVELEERYKESLTALKVAAENDCGKLVVIIVSPEVGKAQTAANTYGIPYILETCSSLNIDCIDLTPTIATNDMNELTLLPDDIHWSKNGSVYISNLLTNIIFRYSNIRSTKTYLDSTRPKIFGDLQPNFNDVVSGEMNLPYKLKVNAQGLRMEQNVVFPKKKQTILFLGNANVYSPYIDNEFIATNLLQKRFPDKVIMNCAKENYTLEDHLSIYEEKAKYAEPDLIFLCTDGNDILNYFFTQRNHFSRIRRSYQPTKSERIFYSEVYNKPNAN